MGGGALLRLDVERLWADCFGLEEDEAVRLPLLDVVFFCVEAMKAPPYVLACKESYLTIKLAARATSATAQQ